MNENTQAEEKLKWYMVTTVSGKERHVIESLENKAKHDNLQDVISEFLVALVPHLTPKGKVTEKNMFPGYIFIKMKMTNDAWFIVRNTLYVTGLVGSSGHRTKPTPVTEIEIAKARKNIEEAKAKFEEQKKALPFKVGDKVKIVNGVLKDEVGPVLEIFADRKVVLVELIQFERKTPTEIHFEDLMLV